MTALADPTGAESANRNYNFFDELDARLVHLEDPESGSAMTAMNTGRIAGPSSSAEH